MVVLAASARLDADDVLRIRWERPPADGAALILRRDDTETTVPMDGAAADLSTLDLADGTWSVHASGTEVMTADPGFSLDGLAQYALRRRTRALHAFRDPSGGLRVRVRTVTPHAEVTAVRPGDETLVVEGFFAYGTAPDTTRITATRRESGDAATGEVTVSGEHWRAELRTDAFAVETERGFWDLRIGDLPVAALLDDIPKKKEKVRYPARYVTRDAVHVRIRPYYTDSDHLAVATTVVGADEVGKP